MTGRELIQKEDSVIDFIEENGKYFFECGRVKGDVSHALQEVIETITLDDVQYVELIHNGNVAIPTLMLVKGNSLL